MKKDTKDLLWNILKGIEDENTSTVLLNLIDFKGEPDNVTYDDLFGKKTSLPVEMKNPGSQAIRDERIKWLTFCNFRSVPDSGELKLYGVNFSINEKPVSVFLVGSNGAGKTTLYSALEHHYMSASSLSKDMKLDEEKILTYGFGAIEGQQPTTLKVKTISREEEERLNDHEGLCSPASFCSEYDLKQLGERGDNLTNYILEQLGYDELIPLITALQAIVTQKNKEIKESQESHESHESDIKVEDIDDIIKVLLQQYLEKSAKDLLTRAKEHESLFAMDYADYSAGKEMERFEDHWKRIQSLSTPPKADNLIMTVGKEGASIKKNAERANELTQKLMKMYRRVEDSLKACQGRGTEGLRRELENLYKDRAPLDELRVRGILPEDEVRQYQQEMKIIETVIDLLTEEQKNILYDFREKRFPMIKDILKIFSNADGELDIQEERVGNGDVMKIVVKDTIHGVDDLKPTPQEYYNSFRYKLYAVSFKIALALMEMKQKEIRVPLVIDDVFNASDFENNIRLEYFVHNIYKAYDRMEMEQPLQLILFTHDEMVQSAFRKGVNVIDDDDDIIRQPREFICGRLFNYRYAKQMSEDLGDESSLFYNLYIQN